jgi:L-asparaginase / beta-aspartyl-peptidase
VRRATCPTIVLLALGCACSTAPAVDERRAPATKPAEWALAIHGGAGAPDRSLPEAEKQAYLASLEHALKLGQTMLEGGRSSLDAVEAVVRDLEDDPLFNAGRGAVFNLAGEIELDASIMDGRTLGCGGVAAVKTVKNPVSLARLVYERTKHVLLVGPGAEGFAQEMGVERAGPEWFRTEPRWQELLKFRAEQASSRGGGTVGAVARDRQGNLAAATSTGGRTGKLPGRVGDSPIVGAGTYADNATCAVSGTGIGEEYIRHAAAYSVSAWMRHEGATLDEALHHVIDEELKPGDGGMIAVDRDGRIAMRYNTPGMFRGAADANGRFEVHIWE